MRTGEIIAAAFWLAVAIGITWSGWDLGLGTLSDPGPGGMIFWVGAAMTALSLATLVAALWRAPANAPSNGPAGGLAGLWQGTRWWLVPYVVALLALYAWLLPVLGFLAVTALLLLVLFATIDRRSWVTPPLAAVLATLAAYIVFHRWLGTQLPAGELERWLTTNLPILFGRS
jgi:putative tricarboxylic transport membrane protein